MGDQPYVVDPVPAAIWRCGQVFLSHSQQVPDRCPIRNLLRVRASSDQRTLNCLRTALGQEIHDNVKVPEEIQKDLRAPEGGVHLVDPVGFGLEGAVRVGQVEQ